ncbi:MAG: hypothetical protein IJ220_01135 [Clostridia bacterium]|nr:hypothetical protein [Clostridia bacterium]
MFSRVVRSLLIMLLVPLAVLIIYWVIRTGEAGFQNAWQMVVSQVTDFWATIANEPKKLVADVKFWQFVGTALVLAMFKN